MGKDEIKNYLAWSESTFNEVFEELANYNGYRQEELIYPMSRIYEIIGDEDVFEVLRMAYYGNFNPNHKFFRFNAYGGIETTNYKDYHSFLNDDFVEELIKNKDHLRTRDETFNRLLKDAEEKNNDKDRSDKN